MRVPFGTQSYKLSSLPVSAQQIINMYVENEPAGSKDPTPIYSCPGLVAFATCGTGPIRGMWNMGGILYVVSGGFLYSVSSAGVSTLLGGTITDTGNVSMSDNGAQLCIVNGTNGYIYSVTSGFQLITDPNFNPAGTVTFFDNYFVFSHTDTNQFFISESLDGTTYSALAFASAEVNPDLVLAVVNQQENLLIFGQETIETWYDSGDVNFPFNRYDGATIERGCAAPLSIIKEDNSVFFLGDDLIFYRLNGVVPVRISTHAIEQTWGKYITQADCTTFSLTWNGHKWIVVTFPSGNATWVYDIATNLWHERVSFNTTGYSMQRWRGNTHCPIYNKQMIGDAFTGQIGYLDDSTFTEYDNLMQAYVVSPIVHSDRKRVFAQRFELDVESGVGLTSGQGSDPQIMLDWSDDGGRIFSSIQPWQSIGKIGAYTQRLRWLRLGQFRNRVYRVTISDPVRRNIIANNMDVKVGLN